MVVYWSNMTTWHHLWGAVLRRDIVKEEQYGKHVVVGVRLVGEVLVETNLCASTGLFGIELHVVDGQVGAHKLCGRVDQRAVAHYS